jgi:hypothetical protein
MTSPSETSPAKQRGRPFAPGRSGNPAGKPKGATNHATRAVLALLDGEAERITRKAVALALEGDPTALRLCLERLAPPRRDSPVTFTLPPITSAADATEAMRAILAAVATGELTPTEAGAVAALVETFRKVAETADLESRIASLEARNTQ